MIEFLKTGNFEYIMVFVLIILLMLFLEILAVCVDFWSGTNTAKALGNKLYSNGFRRSFSKLGDYWRVAAMALIFDCIGSLLPWYSLPFGSMLIAAGVVLTEGRSVWENAKAKKSQAAKLPDAIRAILRCSDARTAEQLLKKLREIDDGQKTA